MEFIEDCFHSIVSKVGQVALLEPISLEAVSRTLFSIVYDWKRGLLLPVQIILFSRNISHNVIPLIIIAHCVKGCLILS